MLWFVSLKRYAAREKLKSQVEDRLRRFFVKEKISYILSL
jgi:hypothetical protein